MKSRSKANPVPFSSGTPKTLALDQESWAAAGPVGTDSGTLETITFQVAVEAVTASRSQRRWAEPSIVLAGPSGSRLELRYWRVSRMKTYSHRPQPNRRERRPAS